MMPIEPVTLSFSAAILLGLSFGAGPCNIACLPYLGPVFMATDQGMRNSWRILLPFSLGRMFGYALLGTAAGWAGLLVQDWIDAPWVRWVLGGATILLALSILWQQKKTRHACAMPVAASPATRRCCAFRVKTPTGARRTVRHGGRHGTESLCAPDHHHPGGSHHCQRSGRHVSGTRVCAGRHHHSQHCYSLPVSHILAPR